MWQIKFSMSFALNMKALTELFFSATMGVFAVLLIIGTALEFRERKRNESRECSLATFFHYESVRPPN